MKKISEKYLNEIKKGFSSEEEFEKFLNSCQLPLKKSIKINIHRISKEIFENLTKNKGWHITQPNFYIEKDILPKDIFYIDRDNTDIPLGKTFFHQSGFFYIQEVAAGMAARQIGPLKGNEIILDISSAPGGKSVQLGDYLLYFSEKNNLTPGLIISNDINKSRIKALAHNLNRMGIYNSGITNFNGFAFGKNLPEFFDHVLVDAPCSGEGTGFKSDAAMKFWHPEEIKKISNTQLQLLISAIKATKPGGTIVFSTCTMNPYENEENIAKILKMYKGIIEIKELNLTNISKGFSEFGELKLLDESIAKKLGRFWPHIQQTGGFFIAKFKKIDTLNLLTKENKLMPKNPFKLDFSQALQKKVKNWLKENWGINQNLEDKFFFISSKELIYVTSPNILKIKNNINFEKIGTPIAKINKRGEIRPTHQFPIIFEKYIRKNYIKIDFDTAQEYALGKDISKEKIIESKIKNPDFNYIAIFFENRGIGIGKDMGDYIKNKYIK